MWFANAGIAGGGGYDAPAEVWQRQWDVNVMSHVHAAQALFPGWIARGEGHLVTTASMAGILTSLGDGVYAVAKHAAVGLAEWLAITHAEHGIKVSCICRRGGHADAARWRRRRRGQGDGRHRRRRGAQPRRRRGRVIDGVREDRFLIYTHPEMREFVVGKAEDPERWIRGMSRLWGRARQPLADEG